jgi:hypothetical protein
MLLTLENFHIMITENKLAHQLNCQPLLELSFKFRGFQTIENVLQTFFCNKGAKYFSHIFVEGTNHRGRIFFFLQKDPFVKFAAAKD